MVNFSEVRKRYHPLLYFVILLFFFGKTNWTNRPWCRWDQYNMNTVSYNHRYYEELRTVTVSHHCEFSNCQSGDVKIKCKPCNSERWQLFKICRSVSLVNYMVYVLYTCFIILLVKSWIITTAHGVNYCQNNHKWIDIDRKVNYFSFVIIYNIRNR